MYLSAFQPLDASNMKELEQSLKSFVKPDETLKIETKVCNIALLVPGYQYNDITSFGCK